MAGITIGLHPALNLSLVQLAKMMKSFSPLPTCLSHYGGEKSIFFKIKPISDTPLEGNTFESPLRELRLYQASFLLRDYGFKLVEIPFDINGNMPSNEIRNIIGQRIILPIHR
jgi:hypothetical protein